jgi:hypothetical protein
LLHVQAGPGGRSVDADAFLKAELQAHARDDAKAAVTGWNDSFDAATSARGGIPTQDQGAQLIRDQPYADLLIGGMTQPGDKLVVPQSLVIAASPANIRAVSAILPAPPAAPKSTP